MISAEIKKLNYLYFKHKNEMLTGKSTNQYFLNLFDYYVRYLQLYIDDDINIKGLSDKDIKINPALLDSFKQYTKTIRDIQIAINKLTTDKEYYEARLNPYFEKLYKYNMFDEYSGIPFIIKDGKGYKNNILDYYIFRTFKLFGNFKAEYNNNEYMPLPKIIADGDKFKIKDVWEKI